MNKTIGNLILMTLICVAVFVVFMAIRPAKAQWTPWGWQPDPYACTINRWACGYPPPAAYAPPPPSYNRGFGFGTR